MPYPENNSTKSRLSTFIQGCSQLQEIYAVEPLTYVNIMGEWWQRINDIIYALGLTETQNKPVTIAWTAPIPGRKRSPFYEEELATKLPNGTDVSEDSRQSSVAGTGNTVTGTNTQKIRAHKYGFIQSVDKLFQRNIDTWGGLYRYFYAQSHNIVANGQDTLKTAAQPADLTEMIFGKQYANANDNANVDRNEAILDMFSRACRNLTGDRQGLANSLAHLIEENFDSAFYDWIDRLKSPTNVTSLKQFFFSTNATADKFTSLFNEATRNFAAADKGLVTSMKHFIEDIFDENFYDWIDNLKTPNDVNGLQQLFFSKNLAATNFTSYFNAATRNLATDDKGIIPTLKHFIEDIFDENFYDWIDNLKTPNDVNGLQQFFFSNNLAANKYTSYFNSATRNLEANDKGLVNSMKHSIEDIFNGTFYDWLDPLYSTTEERPTQGLRQFFFDGNTTIAAMSTCWKKLTTGGLVTESIRLIDTIGGLYTYLASQRAANPKLKPQDFTEMLYGNAAISTATDNTSTTTANDGAITVLFNGATRNLTGNSKGLVNSLKHIIEDIFNGTFYDWIDSLSGISGINGLKQLFFSTNASATSANYTSIFNAATRNLVAADKGILTSMKHVIEDIFNGELYDWVDGYALGLRQIVFAKNNTATDFTSIFNAATRNFAADDKGIIPTLKHFIEDIFDGTFYDWIDNLKTPNDVNGLKQLFFSTNVASGNFTSTFNAATRNLVAADKGILTSMKHAIEDVFNGTFYDWIDPNYTASGLGERPTGLRQFFFSDANTSTTNMTTCWKKLTTRGLVTETIKLIDTIGGLYTYFANQQAINPKVKPYNLTEMLFGNASISTASDNTSTTTENDGAITVIFNGATRNLSGTSKGLANSLRHVIEDIFNGEFYDWVDGYALGLRQIVFSKNATDFTSIFNAATRNLAADNKGIVDSMKHMIEGIFETTFYDWIDASSSVTGTRATGLRQFFFSSVNTTTAQMTTAWGKITTGGIVTELIKHIGSWGGLYVYFANQQANASNHPQDLTEMLFGDASISTTGGNNGAITKIFNAATRNLTAGTDKGLANSLKHIIEDIFNGTFYDWIDPSSSVTLDRPTSLRQLIFASNTTSANFTANWNKLTKGGIIPEIVNIINDIGNSGESNMYAWMTSSNSLQKMLFGTGTNYTSTWNKLSNTADGKGIFPELLKNANTWGNLYTYFANQQSQDPSSKPYNLTEMLFGNPSISSTADNPNTDNIEGAITPLFNAATRNLDGNNKGIVVSIKHIIEDIFNGEFYDWVDTYSLGLRQIIFAKNDSSSDFGTIFNAATRNLATNYKGIVDSLKHIIEDVFTITFYDWVDPSSSTTGDRPNGLGELIFSSNASYTSNWNRLTKGGIIPEIVNIINGIGYSTNGEHLYNWLTPTNTIQKLIFGTRTDFTTAFNALTVAGKGIIPELLKNVEVWGGLYTYFSNQQTPSPKIKPYNLTEMLFGNPSISTASDNTSTTTENDGAITVLFNAATRNLTGNNKGLANSIKHIIENIFTGTFYDWLDSSSSVTGDRPANLRHLIFGSSAATATFTSNWNRLTKGGIVPEIVNIINGIGYSTTAEHLYNWLTPTNTIQKLIFGTRTDFTAAWNTLTTGGIIPEIVNIINGIGNSGDSNMYKWLSSSATNTIQKLIFGTRTDFTATWNTLTTGGIIPEFAKILGAFGSTDFFNWITASGNGNTLQKLIFGNRTDFADARGALTVTGDGIIPELLKNINNWGGLYTYFGNQQANASNHPQDLTEMLFGDASISTTGGNNGAITKIFNAATRNLTAGTDKGLANSLQHLINDVIGANLYDLADPNAGSTDEPNGLSEILFGTKADGTAYTRAEMFTKWKALEIDGASPWNGVIGNLNEFIARIGKGFIDWLGLTDKQCSETIIVKCKIYQANSSKKWPTSSTADGVYSTPYNYRGKITNIVPLEKITDVTNQKFSNDGLECLKNYTTAAVNDIAYVAITYKITGSSSQNIAQTGYFKCITAGNQNTAQWQLISISVNNCIAGIYDKPQDAATTPNANQLCLVRYEEHIPSNASSVPSTLMQMIFGTSNANNICEIWKKLSEGSLIGEISKIEDTIGSDLIDFLDDDNTICGNKILNGNKPAPNSLKELLFGSMSNEDMCKAISSFTGDSIVNEITNITTYLGDSYKKYITNIINPEPDEPYEPYDPNPLNALQLMEEGQVLFGGARNNDQATWVPDYIVKAGYICETKKEADDTKNMLTDQKRIFDTYQRVAISTCGTDHQLDSGDANSIIHIVTSDRPFTKIEECMESVNATSGKWPYVDMEPLNAKNSNDKLKKTAYYIYNSSTENSYALHNDYNATQTVPFISGKPQKYKASMSQYVVNPDAGEYKGVYIKSWNRVSKGGAITEANTSGNLWTYLFATDKRIVTTDWYDTNNEYWTVAEGFWISPKSTLTAGSVLAKGSYAYSSSASTANETLSADRVMSNFYYIAKNSKIKEDSFFYNGCDVVVEKQLNANPTNQHSSTVLDTYTFAAKSYDLYHFWWNVSMKKEWWDEAQCAQNWYRGSFVYPKKSFFYTTPTLITRLAIPTDVYSSAAIIDLASWEYNADKNLIFLGENSIRHTGFLSNKKYANYYLETRANSDTEDDDYTGIIIGGYKAYDTGFVNTIALTRNYANNASLWLALNPADFYIDKIYMRLNVFGAPVGKSSGNPIYLRSINGKYCYYINDSDSNIIDRGYDGFFMGDPIVEIPSKPAEHPKKVNNVWTWPTAEEGYYDNPYSIARGTFTYKISNTTYECACINATNSVYQDTYVTSGPNTTTLKSIDLTNTGNSISSGSNDPIEPVSFTNGTEIKSGRYSLVDPNTYYGTKTWNNVQKMVQTALNLISKKAILFRRTANAEDQEKLYKNFPHVVPYHLKNDSVDTWWDTVSTTLQNEILDSIKHAFLVYNAQGTNIPLIGNNPNTNANIIATAIFKQVIWPKYVLSTYKFEDLLLDDLFKIAYYMGTVYVVPRDKSWNTDANIRSIGPIRGYGVLNCYSGYTPASSTTKININLNSRYIVDKVLDKSNSIAKITIKYQDIFYELADTNGKVKGAINTADNGVNYINQRYPYQGDIIITLECLDSNQVKITASQNNRNVTIGTFDKSKSTQQTMATPLHNIISGNTSYGFTACSNPLTNFTNNVFIDKDASTIYSLGTDQIYCITQTSTKEYTYKLQATDCTLQIYKDFGPGRLISNDLTDKLYYTRGDATIVQRIV